MVYRAHSFGVLATPLSRSAKSPTVVVSRRRYSGFPHHEDVTGMLAKVHMGYVVPTTINGQYVRLVALVVTCLCPMNWHTYVCSIHGKANVALVRYEFSYRNYE